LDREISFRFLDFGLHGARGAVGLIATWMLTFVIFFSVLVLTSRSPAEIYRRESFRSPDRWPMPRTVKKLVEYCNTAWNVDGVPITLGGFAKYRYPQPQTRTEVA
jgi:hypothetical protein